MRSRAMPFGGSISTQTTNSFFCSFFQKLLSGSRGWTCAAAEAPLLTIAGACEPDEVAAGERDLTASAMARMWAGVVPQQPPRMRTPRAAASRANCAKYSGEDLG